ncbi:hypothetical protein PILCRDRAFT_811450 [Piloderma croceum F 1598]|uniref:Small ribosomal subunit protein bS18m n=1 Tax=Piloderma croceum (strain F 1598) TaxID=765440 RepID=A0A0C3BWN0_PILCF|nr:hypothetical protein PILCRDRAFT_811450 [Piloderma croceum F 1598]
MKCFRPALTTAPTASFTTSVARTDNASQAYTDLYGALAEEGKKKVDEEGAIGTQQKTSYGQKQETIRTFTLNKPLHPSEFSRERRVITPRRSLKPWDLGPPAKLARHKDPFHQMGIDPLDECLNSTLLSQYVTSMGRIEKRAVTRLTSKSQRKISKAIKRAKMMGIIPIHSRVSSGLFHFSK